MLTYLLSLLAEESDRLILTEMVGRYEQLSLKVADSILRNHNDTEDAVMAAWVSVIEHFDTAKRLYRKSQDIFKKWLTAVVRNTAKDEWRKRKKRPAPVEMWEIPSTANVEIESEVRMAAELIRSMPEQYSRVLTMRIFQEYSFKEIGKSLGCSTGTAQRRFNQALAAFRELMSAKQGEE